MGRRCWRASFNCHQILYSNATDIKLGSSTYRFLLIHKVPSITFQDGQVMRPLGCKAPIPYHVSYDFSSSSFISHPWHCCCQSEDSCRGLCMPQLFGQHRTLHTGGNNWQCPPAKSHIVHWCRQHTDNSNQNPHNVDRNLTGDQHLCWPHSNVLLGSHTFETRLEKIGARSFPETTRSF